MQVKQVKFACFRATDKKEKGAGVDTGDRQTFPPPFSIHMVEYVVLNPYSGSIG